VVPLAIVDGAGFQIGPVGTVGHVHVDALPVAGKRNVETGVFARIPRLCFD
jgi:hypothetical protein